MEKQNFVDYIRIHCRSGRGGDGCVHFMRLKYQPRGGPDGGDGGRGGHIILRGNAQLWTLLHLRWKKHIVAGDGEPGGKNNRKGKDGRDVVIEVPLGTIARDEQSGRQEAEILEDGQELIWIPGGRGGLGNAHFATPTRQTPEFAQKGEPGQDGWKILELKLLADVGMVGFPNAGKSTLLATLTAAKPAIAPYPFTTLQPQLGIVAYRDGKSFCMADLPGIIEGAAEGRGLGLRFLRHIERNAVLLFVIPADSQDALAEWHTLLHELEKYNPELLHKRMVVAISKSDLVSEARQAQLKQQFPSGIPLVVLSAHQQKGLQELKDVLWQQLHGN